MSFEVVVQSFRHGGPAGIPRRALRKVFGKHLSEPEPDFWKLRYDELNYCDLYLSFWSFHGDPGMVTGFTVHRPCPDPRLWDALMAILALGDVVLYYPGYGLPLVVRDSVAAHMPEDMVKSLGRPLVVTSGREILQRIQND